MEQWSVLKRWSYEALIVHQHTMALHWAKLLRYTAVAICQCKQHRHTLKSSLTHLHYGAPNKGSAAPQVSGEQASYTLARRSPLSYWDQGDHYSPSQTHKQTHRYADAPHMDPLKQKPWQPISWLIFLSSTHWNSVSMTTGYDHLPMNNLGSINRIFHESE